MDIKTLIPILIQASLFLIILSFGLRTHASRLFSVIRRGRGLWRGIAAVYIVVPLAAVLACAMFPIDREIKVGIVLMAVSPLAPVIPAKSMEAGIAASEAVADYVVLIVFAVVFVPATLWLLSVIYPENAQISPAAVGKLVALSILLPIGLGVAVATWAPGFADRAAPIAFRVGAIAIALVAVAILYKQGGAILDLVGDGTLAAIVLTTTAAIGGGYLLGWPKPARSNVLAISAAIRHPGIAALIARDNLMGPRVMLTVILFLLTSVVVAFVYGLWFKRAHAPTQAVSEVS